MSRPRDVGYPTGAECGDAGELGDRAGAKNLIAAIARKQPPPPRPKRVPVLTRIRNILPHWRR